MTPKQIMDRWHARLGMRGFDMNTDWYVRRLKVKHKNTFKHTCWVSKRELFDFHVEVQEGANDASEYFTRVPQSFHWPRPAIQTASSLAKLSDADQRAKMFMAAIITSNEWFVCCGCDIWSKLELYDHKIWHPTAKFTLPSYDQPQWFRKTWSGVERLYEEDDIIDYLADVTAAIMEETSLVTFVFGDDGDADVIEKIEHKRELQRQRYRLLDAQIEESNKIYQLRSEWDKLSTNELEEMIWTKPLSELSKQSGYSDGILNRRCRQLGIKTPPRGFWAKVHAGVIPHPKGVAQS